MGSVRLRVEAPVGTLFRPHRISNVHIGGVNCCLFVEGGIGAIRHRVRGSRYRLGPTIRRFSSFSGPFGWIG